MSFTVEFESKSAADAARDEHAEYVCPLDDDRRLTKVAFVDDTPKSVEQRIRGKDGGNVSLSGWGASISGTALNRAEQHDIIKEGVRQRALAALQETRPWDEESNVSPDWTEEEIDAVVTALRDYYRHTPPGASIMGDNDETRERVESALNALGSEPPEDDHEPDEAEEDHHAKTCDHARNHCENGDPRACEFLRESCDMDDDEVSALLSDEPRATDDEITGKAAGALGRAWQGYKAGVNRLERGLSDTVDAKANAEQAAAAINAVRADHGQEAMEFDRLEELSDELQATGGDAHDAQGHVEETTA